MKWNWMHKDWPQWCYDQTLIQSLESEFLLKSGKLLQAWNHLSDTEQIHTTIEILTEEAVQTSAIEGEILNRSSVQSSVRREFGLSAKAKFSPIEKGITELLADVFHNYEDPMSHEALNQWHLKLFKDTNPRFPLGEYRKSPEPMQVISGPTYKPKVHFQAPPSCALHTEMDTFINWFNNPSTSLPALARSGIGHLYFVSIHPFEDGNGRIARAISEKILAQHLGQPSLVSLASQIKQQQKSYYDALAHNNKKMDITHWLCWWGETVLKAQAHSLDLIAHLIAKTECLDRLGSQINHRQKKVLIRLFDAGPQGFLGGLSSHNYQTITGTSSATASRDLADLVLKKALTKTGKGKGTRYALVAKNES